MDIEQLTVEQLRLIARKKEIAQELEKLDKKHIRALEKTQAIHCEIMNLQDELIPLRNGFWEGKKVIEQ